MGNNIASERVRRGMTRQNLADELEVSPSTIKSWEIQKTYPNSEYIKLMCKLFRCSSDYLLGMTDERVA